MRLHEEVFCFAYGSNMSPQRLTAADRAPSARPVGSAALRSHRLSFDKLGTDASGKCTIHASRDVEQVVYGVVYRLDRGELPALDAAEGGYERIKVTVHQCASGRTMQVETYRALPELVRPSLAPFDWYHALVVEGSRRAGHPRHYVEQLATQATKVDGDELRRRAHFALLNIESPARV